MFHQNLEKFFSKEKRKVMGKRIKRMRKPISKMETREIHDTDDIFQQAAKKVKMIFQPTYKLPDEEGQKIRKRCRLLLIN